MHDEVAHQRVIDGLLRLGEHVVVEYSVTVNRDGFTRLDVNLYNENCDHTRR